MEQGRDSAVDFPSPARRLAELEALVAEQQATIAAYQQQLEQAREQLLLLKRALFSSRRERYVPSPDQRLLFPSPSCEPPPDADLAAGEAEGVGFLALENDEFPLRARQVRHGGDAPALVDEAFKQLRSGRPRPVEIEIPPDTLFATADMTLPAPAPATTSMGPRTCSIASS